jgi:hypothetical protein
MNDIATAGLKVKNIYRFECFGPDGNLKWVEEVENLTVNAGLNDLLSQYFKGSSYTAAWFAGLKGTGTAVAADTMASHASWTEIAGYAETVRQTLVLGSISGQSVDNSASKAVFTSNATATVAGAFVCNNSTKSGSTGTLYGVADFAVARIWAALDVINLTVIFTAATA